MSTFQKFIQYYKPYKKVFIFDLICAAFISLVDLAYPQILRSLTKTLFLKDASMILKTLPIIGGILFICYIFQAFCKYYVSCAIYGRSTLALSFKDRASASVAVSTLVTATAFLMVRLVNMSAFRFNVPSSFKSSREHSRQ